MNDLDLIERLRAAGTQAPASRHTPDAVLAAGRRAQARRNVLRISGAALGLAVVVAAGTQLVPGNSGTQVVTAAGDPGDGGQGTPPAGKPAPRSPAELDPAADRVNAKILQTALGDDFDVRDDLPDGTLRAGSESAAGLPASYAGSVSLVASVSSKDALAKQCAPMKEKGGIFDACVAHPLADGREVEAKFSRWAPTADYPQKTAGEAVRVLFLQPNNTLTYVDLVTSTDAANSTDISAAAAQKWLGSMVDRLGAAAANPDVEPVAFDGDAGPANKDAADAKQAVAPDDSAAGKKAAAVQEAKAAQAAQAAQAAKQAPTAQDDAATAKAAAAKKAAAAQEAQAGKGGPPTGK